MYRRPNLVSLGYGYMAMAPRLQSAIVSHQYTSVLITNTVGSSKRQNLLKLFFFCGLFSYFSISISLCLNLHSSIYSYPCVERVWERRMEKNERTQVKLMHPITNLFDFCLDGIRNEELLPSASASKKKKTNRKTSRERTRKIN